MSSKTAHRISDKGCAKTHETADKRAYIEQLLDDGLTPVQIAERLNVDQNRVSTIKTHRVHCPIVLEYHR